MELVAVLLLLSCGKDPWYQQPAEAIRGLEELAD